MAKDYKKYNPIKRKRKSITRPVGELVPGLTQRALGRYGFGQTALISDWHRIVGEKLAAYSLPLKITFPRGKRVGGCLHVKVIGPMALELQHMEPLLLERINTYFGYGAVASVRLKQAGAKEAVQQAIRKKNVKAGENAANKIPLAKGQQEEIEARYANVENDEMREILTRLALSVARRNLATKSS